MLRVLGGTDRPSQKPQDVADSSHALVRDGVLAGLLDFNAGSGRGAANAPSPPDPAQRVYRRWLGLRRVLCVADPTLAGRILRNDDGAWSERQSAFSRRCPQEDVSVFLQPAFDSDALRGYVDAAAPMFERAVAAWTTQRDLELDTVGRELFACVAANTLMGVTDTADALRLARAARVLRAGNGAWLRRQWFGPTGWRARRTYRTLFVRFRAEVDSRRVSDAPDLLSRMCQGAVGGDSSADDALVRTFLALMSDAFDGASDGVTRMAYVLATHPVWQERLQTEAILTTLGRPSYDALATMPRHDQAWTETLRCRPMMPTLFRVAHVDTEVGGLHIEKGALVAVRLSAALRDPNFWHAPDTFDPDRFNRKRVGVRPNLEGFVPFGIGPYAPWAERFCALQAKVFWHAFGTRARMRLASGYDSDQNPLYGEPPEGALHVVVEALVPREPQDEGGARVSAVVP
ncbi:MAG: cytochrome P450 [Polyangiales bacterium]